MQKQDPLYVQDLPLLSISIKVKRKSIFMVRYSLSEKLSSLGIIYHSFYKKEIIFKISKGKYKGLIISNQALQ